MGQIVGTTNIANTKTAPNPQKPKPEWKRVLKPGLRKDVRWKKINIRKRWVDMAKIKAKKNIMVEVIQPLLDDIDEATEPKKMSKAEALDTLEIIIDQLKSRTECLKEEMGNEEND